MGKTYNNLSLRLRTVADMVTKGYIIADIGTDHGFVPISLIERKIISSAIAMDVNQGPLEIAKDNINRAGLTDKIKVRQSDGFERLKPNEVDCVVLAGMGGNLVIKILSEYWEVTKSLKECVLQPQSEWVKVRIFLMEHDFTIIQEEMVNDGGKYYLMMKVVAGQKPIDEDRRAESSWGERKSWSQTELSFGKLLLESKNPILKEYLLREIALKEEILEQLRKEVGEHIDARRKEVLDEINLLKDGLELL